MHSQKTFSASVASPSLARAFVREELAAVCDTPTLDAAVLMVSELVTNAVTHRPSPVEVSLATDRDRARVEVSDQGPGWAPVANVPGDQAAECGRGLSIVEACALRWGSRHDDGRTTIWFEVAGQPWTT